MESYAIVFFPKIDFNQINAFRKKYDQHWNIIPPHITLVSSFSDISEEQIFEHLETVTKDVKPFQIHLQGLIKTDDNLLFLLTKEGREELVKIHDLLYLGIFASLEQKYIFDPHITLGECNTEDIQIAYTEAEAINPDIYTNFDSISLIRGNGVSPAKIIGNFELK